MIDISENLSTLITLLIAICSGFYAILTNTKKYELTENYKKELLNWYKSVIDVMIKIIHLSESGELFSDQFHTQKINLLSQLSSLTELGRFYFPNVIKCDDFGSNKPSAYQGYRHITLEFLLYFYEIVSKNNSINSTEILWKLERQFTSVIFNMINPRKRNHDYSKYLKITIPKGQSIEDYISKNPDNIDTFM